MYIIMHTYLLSLSMLKYWFSLQKLQCSPTSDGAAAAVLASEEFVKAHGLQDKGNHPIVKL